MKLLSILFLIFLSIGGFQNIAEINAHVQQAEENFKMGNYAAAVKNYEFVLYTRNHNTPEILLNLAHAYLKNNQPEQAQKVYLQCAKSEDAALRSVAWEQLGTLQTKIPDYRQALTFYKRALVANPANEQARYNYEMLKKYLAQNPEKQNQLPPPAPEKKEKQEEKKTQPDQKENKDQSAKPDANGNQEKDNPENPEKGDQQEKQDKEMDPEGKNQPEQQKPAGENGTEKKQNQGTEKGKEAGENLASEKDEPAKNDQPKRAGREQASGDEQRLQTQYERLRQANISPEKANMMLEAMKNAEQQHLQQLPKKGTKKPDRSKPNW